MGDTTIIKKEESTADNSFEQFFKKEEDIGLKVEAAETSETSRDQASFYETMTIPWNLSQKYTDDINVGFCLLDTSYCGQQWVRKPFKIVKVPEDRSYLLTMRFSKPLEQTRETISIIMRHKKRKRTPRTSAVKNYVGLICTGLSRTVLTASKGSEILATILQILRQKKVKFGSLECVEDKDLLEFLKEYMHENMCGKKVKKTNCERDFKVRSTAELNSLLAIQHEDDELTTLKKEALKEILNYFFVSEYFDQWLSNGMVTESNRIFLRNNKEELHRKFLNPVFYKPRFSYDNDPEMES